MPDQDDAPQIEALDLVDDVLDMGLLPGRNPCFSASPDRLSACTSCPAPRSSDTTSSHAHAPSHAPATTTNRVMLPT